MALIKTLRGKTPVIHPSVYLAENATIIGDVSIGEGSTIWFQSVIRGDVNKIQIGKNVNIQDGAIIHGTFELFATEIGDNVSIGHGAIIHGCTIMPNVLIGMGAVIMDEVVISSNVIIAAGTIVPPRKKLESGFVYAGNPAKILKPITKEQSFFFINRTAEAYKKYASWYTNEDDNNNDDGNHTE